MFSSADPYSVSGVDAESIARRNDAGGKASPFDLEYVGHVGVVTLLDDDIVDAVQIEQLSRAIERRLQDESCTRVVIDLQNVLHLSSAAIGMFLKLRAWTTDQGGGFRLCSVNDHLKNIFTVTKLESALGIHEQRSEAVKSLGK